MNQVELITINNVLDDFDAKIESWVRSELERKNLPDYYGWELIVNTFKDKRSGFSARSIHYRLELMPSMKKYKNEFQSMRSKKRRFPVTKKSVLNKLSKKSFKELKAYAEPGSNLLNAFDKK